MNCEFFRPACIMQTQTLSKQKQYAWEIILNLTQVIAAAAADAADLSSAHLSYVPVGTSQARLKTVALLKAAIRSALDFRHWAAREPRIQMILMGVMA